MGKKGKSDSTRLDEVDRSIYSSFCSAANSLSQLYSQAVNQQRLSFQAGERHAMERLYGWILRKHEEGVRMTSGDIIAYVLNELNEEPSQSPRVSLPSQQNQNQAPNQHGIQVSSNAFGPATTGQGSRSGHSDQSKNSVFSNALSSPVRRSLQKYHLSQGAHSTNDGSRANDNTARYPNQPSSNDTSMDMHADSPGHDSPY